MLLFVILACGTTPVVDTAVTTETTTSTIETAVATGTTDPASHQSKYFGAIDSRLDINYGSLVTVSWDQPAQENVYIAFEVDPGEWRTTPTQNLSVGPAQFLLLGIPYDTDFSFHIVSTASTSDTFTRATGTLPLGFPAPTLLTYEPDATVSNDRFLIGSANEDAVGWAAGTYWKFIVDRLGRVVWAEKTLDKHWTIYARIALSGTEILWDEASWWAYYDFGAQSKVSRKKIDGTVTQSWDTPGLHHAFVELGTGEIAWGSAMSWTNESLVKRFEDEPIQTIWDCKSIDDGTGNCQSNTLYWNQETDTFLYSFYTTNSVVEIDHKTGDTLKLWGDLKGAWAFDPPESQFWWQHGLNILDNGNLLLSTKSDYTPWETLAVEYEIDEKNETLRRVWSFGEGEAIYGSTAGEAHRLANGNTLHNYGAAGRLREVTSIGEVVWDLDWGENRLIGRTIFTDDLYRFAP
jgi:hypothetical protein